MNRSAACYRNDDDHVRKRTLAGKARALPDRLTELISQFGDEEIVRFAPAAMQDVTQFVEVEASVLVDGSQECGKLYQLEFDDEESGRGGKDGAKLVNEWGGQLGALG